MVSKGRNGLSGAIGPVGVAGHDGINGAPGAVGPNGDPGAPGANGADGAPGQQGPPGVDGLNGAPGRDGIDGVSMSCANELALKQAVPAFTLTPACEPPPPPPPPVPTPSTQLAAGVQHSCALLADTTVKCWGYNIYGGLGNGTSIDSTTPVSVIGL